MSGQAEPQAPDWFAGLPSGPCKHCPGRVYWFDETEKAWRCSTCDPEPLGGEHDRMSFPYAREWRGPGKPSACGCETCCFHQNCTGTPAPTLPELGWHGATLVKASLSEWRFELAGGQMLKQRPTHLMEGWPTQVGARVSLLVTHRLLLRGPAAVATRCRLMQRPSPKPATADARLEGCER